MADYVKRNYSGQEIKVPNSYDKVVIESYDPNNIRYSYNGPITGTNVTKEAKDWMWVWKAKGAGAFTLTQVLNITEAGDYRVEVFGFTTTYPETVELKFNNQRIRTPISMKARDRFFRKVDFGVHKLNSGTLNISAICGEHVEIATIYLKKIRKITGDTKNNGQLVFYKAKASIGMQDSPDTLEMDVKHEYRSWNEGGFLEPKNRTGLVFEYKDAVNYYTTDETGTLRQIFGGYITSAIESADLMSIELKCAGRLLDAENRHVLKEVSVGGQTANTNLLYNAPDLYDALLYLAEAVELPISNNNFQQLKNAIPSKKYYRVDYSQSGAKSALSVNNILKTPYSSNILLRNGPKKGTTQYAVLWDSGWNKKEESKGFDIKDKPVFYFEYGMGAEPKEGEFKVWVPKEYTPKTKKVKKGTGVYKTVKGNVGYDTSKPFMAWIEIQYSTTPTGTRITRNIDFTATTATNKMGEIIPILVNNMKKVGEFDVGDYLDTNEPESHYYLRRIALKYVAPGDNDLYDPATDNSANKILLYSAGFREGEAILPELLQASGKKVSELFKQCREKLGLNLVMLYAENRCDDKVLLAEEKSSGVLVEFKEGLGGNIASISNISYPAVSTLKNSIIKVFKESDNVYRYVHYKSEPYIFRFGSHEDVEVLNEDVGAYYAQNMAKKDADYNTSISHTYTIEVDGYYNVRVGQYVITTLDNKVYNDLQLIKSIEYTYDVYTRPMGHMTIGLGESSPEMKAKLKFQNIRRTTQQGKRRLFSGGAEAVDTSTEVIDLFG